jgi:FkbM family methyltransferase
MRNNHGMRKKLRYLRGKLPFYNRLRRRMASSDPAIPQLLKNVSGIVHIGANQGQEARLYARLDLDVIWIEPIPEVFAALEENIRPYPKQKAFNLLMADTDGEEFEFHISNEGGVASSIFELGQVSAVWPDIGYVDTLRLKSTTFAHLVDTNRIDLSRYQAMILDTQGAELKILKGCGDTIKSFHFIQAEAADYEAYLGCCVIDDLVSYLGEKGFVVREKNPFKTAEAGTYFDVVFENTAI